MKPDRVNPGKEVYKQLRSLSCRELWEQEVSRFELAKPQERIERVGVIRAVGVVFSASGSPEEKEKARIWLRGLLRDPSEIIRRYAITALPKMGGGTDAELELLALLRTSELDREKKFLGQALEKIGGKATLDQLEKSAVGSHIQQKVKASLARSDSPSEIRMDQELSDFSRLKIHLRGRRGLEQIVRGEVEDSPEKDRKFRVVDLRPGLVTLIPLRPFTLGDIYRYRCFGSACFELGNAKGFDELAAVITSQLSLLVLETFTRGSMRYRLDFPTKGHQRGAVKNIANEVYLRCPALLNSAQAAPWTISIHPTGTEYLVELSLRHSLDPRFYYRQQDVPAASHPPLAACMARLAGARKSEVVWDPFCGSGLELIERALLGGVQRVYGTDRSREAISISERNLAAAHIPALEPKFICCDFRDFANVEKSAVNSVTLIISNPPMGKRVPIPNLKGLMEDFFAAAAVMLKTGGRLVFANPLRMETSQTSLKLNFREVIDFGGFDCRLEMYTKVARGFHSQNDPGHKKTERY